VTDLGLSDQQWINLVLGIIQHESSGESGALGDDGCSYGLMQVNWCWWSAHDQAALRYPQQDQASGTWSLIGVTSGPQLYTAWTNVGVGMNLLLDDLLVYQDINAAVVAYNGDDSQVQAWIQGGPQPENIGYLYSVLDILGVPADYFDQLVKKKT
jgi:hypothetical protein